MISPERFRNYPFFGQIDESQLTQIAMIAEDAEYQNGDLIFREGEKAVTLYFLLEGYVDLYYTFSEGKRNSSERGIPVGEINPGELFGISALIEPNLLTSTAFASGTVRVIEIDASMLRRMLKKDRRLAHLFMHQVAKAAIERLHSTRVQLAAAWA